MSFVVIALVRTAIPFELEWVEGALLDHVTRILNGKSLYVPPSVDFVPCIYTPLYYYVCALVSKALGLAGFLPLRLVSMVSSLFTALLVLRTVHRETGSLSPSVVATGLFFASYGVVDFWFDLARVDALFLVLLSSSLYLLRFSRGLASIVIAAAFGALAVQTKQAAFAVLLPVAVHQLWTTWARGVWFGAALVLLTAASMAWLARDGWYFYYVLELPAQHGWNVRRIVTFWCFDFVPLFLPSIVFAAYTHRLPERSGNVLDRDAQRYWLVAGAGMVAAAWMSWFHVGAARNVFLPACVAMSVMTGFALASFEKRMTHVDGRRRSHCEAVGYSCLVLQFALLAYNPWDAFASGADRERAELVESVARSHDSALLPLGGHVRGRHSDAPHAHCAPMMDVLIGREGPEREMLKRSVKEAIEALRFDAIVLPMQSDIASALSIADVLPAFYGWQPLRTTPDAILDPRRLGVWTVRLESAHKEDDVGAIASVLADHRNGLRLKDR